MSVSWRIIIFAAIFGITSAAPSLLPRQAATTQLTFTGAGASFSVNAPVDGSAVTLSRLLQLVQRMAITTTKLTRSRNRQHLGRRLHRSSRDCKLFIRGRRWSEAHRTWSQCRRHHRTTPDDRACELSIVAFRDFYSEEISFCARLTKHEVTNGRPLNFSALYQFKVTIVHNFLV